MPDDKLKQIQKLLDVAEGNLHSARNLLLAMTGDGKMPALDHKEIAKDMQILDEGKVIEGVFDGLEMVAPDGKKYAIPANYASKSKLVDGDSLKLTIAEDGSFIFKQIGPIKRKRIIGVLTFENGDYTVMAEGKNYKVLQASVTYYKGQPGNRVTIIVPKEKDSQWAAFESVIHDHEKTEEPISAESDADVIKPANEAEEPLEEPIIEPENEEIKENIDEKVIEEPVEDKKADVSGELPDENEEVLKTIRESMGSQPKTKKEPETKIPEPEVKQVKPEPEIKAAAKIELNSVEEALEQEVPVSSEPKIIHHGTGMPDEEQLVNNEKETNSLGEEQLEKKEEKTVEELEI